jgi:hypothetical protein
MGSLAYHPVDELGSLRQGRIKTRRETAKRV